jgi:hypothetical protein
MAQFRKDLNDRHIFKSHRQRAFPSEAPAFSFAAATAATLADRNVGVTNRDKTPAKCGFSFLLELLPAMIWAVRTPGHGL